MSRRRRRAARSRGRASVPPRAGRRHRDRRPARRRRARAAGASPRVRERDHAGAEDVHALDIDALLDPSVTFFSYRADGGELLGVGALKRLDDEHAEIKSMHTAAAARGRGVGRAIVDHLLAGGPRARVPRVSLETGAGPAFAPPAASTRACASRRANRSRTTRPSPNSAYMTRALNRHVAPRSPFRPAAPVRTVRDSRA